MKKQKKTDFLQILASHATKNKYLIMISTASNYQYSMHMSEVIYHIKGMLFMLMFVSHILEPQSDPSYGLQQLLLLSEATSS